MDGLEVLNSVRALEHEQPFYIIMLTSKSKKTDIITGLNAGADDYLAKPFDIGELQARVEVGRRMIDMQKQLAEQFLELHQAMDHIKTLQGILPICSFCKKIRDDEGYWDRVEVYVEKHSDAEFSHGICPECMKIHYPEYNDDENT
jgi:response regulator RpfG family c-di-GMP phosphodiesterase